MKIREREFNTDFCCLLVAFCTGRPFYYKDQKFKVVLSYISTLRIAWDTQNLVLQKQSKIKNKTIETGVFASILHSEMLKYKHMSKG